MTDDEIIQFCEGYDIFSCVGEGWHGILRNLVTAIKKSGEKSISVSQVKEKFGGLRFYTNGNNTCTVDTLITNAEIASCRTCETCGNPGSIRGKGWVTCMCDDCEEGNEL